MQVGAAGGGRASGLSRLCGLWAHIRILDHDLEKEKEEKEKKKNKGRTLPIT